MHCLIPRADCCKQIVVRNVKKSLDGESLLANSAEEIRHSGLDSIQLKNAKLCGTMQVLCQSLRSTKCMEQEIWYRVQYT